MIEDPRLASLLLLGRSMGGPPFSTTRGLDPPFGIEPGATFVGSSLLRLANRPGHFRDRDGKTRRLFFSFSFFFVPFFLMTVAQNVRVGIFLSSVFPKIYIQHTQTVPMDPFTQLAFPSLPCHVLSTHTQDHLYRNINNKT